MAALVGRTDWASNPLGPLSGWPQSLRVAVGICLNSRFPMFVWWGAGLINIYNDAYAPILGKRHPDALGRAAPDVWSDIWPSLRPQAEAVMTRGEATWNERVPLVMERNGYPESTYFTWSYSPIPDGDSGVGGLFCAVVEETRQVRAEEAAREAERRYRAVFEAARDAMIVYTPEGVIVEVNPAATRTYGYAREELLGVDARRAVDAEALPMFEAFLRAAGAGEEFRCDTVDRRRDGTRFPIEVVGTPLTYDGRPHVMAVVRDITERTRAVERIARLHGVAAALTEALTVADVARVAVEHGITALGATAGSLSLLTEDGTSLEMAGSVGYPAGMMDRWKRFSLDEPIPLTDAVRLGKPIYLSGPEERLRRYPALATVTANRATQASACIPLLIGGTAVGVLALSFDQAGAFTADDHEFAFSLGRQCAQALERARLFEAERRARDEAERASRMKDEFLATLSHELRTPLNAILGWSQVIRREAPAGGELAQGLEVIERNARAQAQIIEDLLDMSRIISGKVRLDVQRVDVPSVVRAAVETVRPTADAKGVRLQAVVDPGTAPVFGDPSRLQQVLWNLLTNAIKFTPKGGRVQVMLERVNSHLELGVVDTGEGIAPEFLPFVFDRFRQADSSTTRRYGGLGLGLSIVRQLVELHGGTIRARSPGVGQGSSFIVKLPLTPVHPEPGQKTERRDSASGRGATPADNCATVRGVRVLVVDDEPDARALLKRVLEDCEAVVTTAGSAREAFAHVREGRFDVLVSDIGMPEEDGYALIRQVRSLAPEQGGKVPAIALTAYARGEDRVKSVVAGFQMHMPKPVEPTELVAMVASLSGWMGG